ncbi:MAG TPA: hypothetical protein DCO77_08970 [Nitrospiraceae bacterium]|nr:hypothetical protein [Nitrospiraceae bacterium]
MFYTTYGLDNITPEELRMKFDSHDDFLLLDVRTPLENAAQALDGSYLIPVQELAHRVSELPKDREIVVYCKIGNRSAFACVYLARMGYRVKNLDGGIALWNRSQTISAARA